MMTSQNRSPVVVGLGGTCRPESVSTRLLQKTLSLCAEKGARTEFFGGSDLETLPLFDARHPMPHPTAVPLVDAIRAADAVVVATPGYHGAMSGLVKNALDHVEALRDDDRPYLDGRPVGIIVAAAGWQACGTTLSSMRSVVHALRGWPTPLAVMVNSAEPPPSRDGEGALDAALVTMAEQLLRFSDAMSPSTPASATR